MSVHFWSWSFKTLLELNLHGWWTWFTVNFNCFDRPKALSAEDWSKSLPLNHREWSFWSQTNTCQQTLSNLDSDLNMYKPCSITLSVSAICWVVWCWLTLKLKLSDDLTVSAAGRGDIGSIVTIADLRVIVWEGGGFNVSTVRLPYLNRFLSWLLLPALLILAWGLRVGVGEVCSISPVPVAVLRVEAVRGRGCISSSSFVSDEQLNPFCVENVDRIPPEYDIDLLCLEFFWLNAMVESLVLYSSVRDLTEYIVLIIMRCSYLIILFSWARQMAVFSKASAVVVVRMRDL